MTRLPRLALTSSSWLIGALLIGGCGAAARPAVLDDASSMLTRKETGELQKLRPELVREARERLKEAESAHARGDDESASLYANIAIARYQTAVNFVERDSALVLARARRADDSATSAERKRLAALEERLRRFESNGKKDRALDDAHGVVLKARDRQAEAIREGAPATVPARYGAGRDLVDTAVDHLAGGDAKEATRDAERAIAIFDEVILLARDRRADAPAAPTPAPAAPSGPVVVVAPSTPAAAPAPAVAPAPAESDRGGATRAIADQRILELQLKRTELIGQGARERCGDTFSEFEATLALAEQRFDARDYPRALEVAVLAGERVRACDPRSAPSKDVKEPTKREDAAVRGRALSALMKAQGEQAQATAKYPEDRRLTQSGALVTRAEQWFEKQEYEVSEGFSRDASLLLAEIARTPETDKSASKEPKGAQPAKVSCQASQDRILMLKQQLARVPEDASPEQKKQRQDALTTLGQASQRASAGDCAKADELTSKISRVTEELPGASEPLPLESQQVEDWRLAFEAAQQAMRARGQAQPRTDAGRTLFTRADAHLERAKKDYQARRFREAETNARLALEGFQAIGSVDAGARPPALPAAPAAALAAAPPSSTRPEGGPAAPPTSAEP
ncbi:MAG: hypothetical protein OZ921_10010, partial [Sorangiineae bacterium]|nr:hypothetical protein [Sorangiineae bacterium]